MNRKILGVKILDKNSFVFGESGKGKAFHSWDYLKGKKCLNCSQTGLLLVGKDLQDYWSGFPYYVKCESCGYIIPKPRFDSYEKEYVNGSTASNERI